ncbi:MAG TPA: nucleotidyltransferase domain-containing protein [Gemmatimonadales bacterium]|nr:nucleotidyltransferase domain-containing protein [Gemmatimonadales bacterium]
MQETIDRIVTPALDRLDAVLPAGYSAVLYGSAARGEFLPGISDLNLLVVCEALDAAALRQVSGAVAGLRKDRQPPPLLIERDEWERAVDVFPIEITDMQVAYTVLRGADPVAGRRVDPADLRRALEAELRAKLLRLRQAYAAGFGDAKLLGQVASGTVSSVATLYRAALVLLGKPVSPETPDGLGAAGEAMGIDTVPVLEVWRRRRQGVSGCSPELFEGYLSAVAAAVRVTDQFTRGGS